MRRRRPGAIGFALILVAIFAFLTSPVDARSLEETAAQIVADERNASHTPAISAILLRDGRVLARVVDGMADPQAGIPAETDTAFPAGSVTKILTAALVMTEVDAGRLELDLPVAEYVPRALRPLDGEGNEVDVTLRQLLSHSSGLPVTWDGFPPNPPVEDRDAYIAASRTVVHPPGDRIVYSNAGFALAGEIAAVSAGMSFEDLAQTRLFEPLGMTRSSLKTVTDYGDQLAAGHRRGSDGAAQPEAHIDLTPMAAAGGLLTTPDDLARFARMLLEDGVFEGRQILSAAAVDQMMQLQARTHPALEEGFGLGFGVRVRDGQRKVWWDGTTSSAAAHFALLPDWDAAVIVMANIADNHPTSVTGRRLLALAVPEIAHAPEPAAAALETFAGYYLAADFVDPDLWFLAYAMPLRVGTDGGSLAVTSALTGPMTFVPVAADRFRIDGGMLDGASALFEGKTLQAGFVRAERLPVLLTPPALIAYAGAAVLVLVFLVGLGLRALWRRVRQRRQAA